MSRDFSKVKCIRCRINFSTPEGDHCLPDSVISGDDKSGKGKPRVPMCENCNNGFFNKREKIMMSIFHRIVRVPDNSYLKPNQLKNSLKNGKINTLQNEDMTVMILNGHIYTAYGIPLDSEYTIENEKTTLREIGNVFFADKLTKGLYYAETGSIWPDNVKMRVKYLTMCDMDILLEKSRKTQKINWKQGIRNLYNWENFRVDVSLDLKICKNNTWIYSLYKSLFVIVETDCVDRYPKLGENAKHFSSFYKNKSIIKEAEIYIKEFSKVNKQFKLQDFLKWFDDHPTMKMKHKNLHEHLLELSNFY